MREQDNPEWKFTTRCVHTGEGVDSETKAIRRPIVMANSYEMPTDVEELLKVVSWDDLDKFEYNRELGANQRFLEKKLASLEGTEDCVVTASGMGAIGATLFTLLNSGDHIIASEVCYTGTQKLLGFHMKRFGVEVDLVDTENLEEIQAALKPNTKAIFIETPSNPFVGIADIKAVADMAHSKDLKLIVDSTWSGITCQSPKVLGADIIIHSATKYINGHGDALGGAVLGDMDFLKEVREYGIVHMGACISPFNAWLIMRGINTLPLRMEKHSDNAMKVAEFLEKKKGVTMVRYPGLESHPRHEIAKKQMSSYSGMLNFRLDLELIENLEFLKNLQLITFAVSLGHDQSLIYFLPTYFFFEDMVVMDDRQKAKYTELMGEGVYRFSVGIEDPEDLIEDLDRAIDAAYKAKVSK